MKEENYRLKPPEIKPVPVTDDGPTYTYEQNYVGAESGGNPSVNLAIGRLRHTFADLSVGHGTYSIGLSHVYNSRLSSKFRDLDFGVGKGWKLNLQQLLVEGNVDANGNKTVKYLDELGETHTFINYGGNSYYDERNAQTVLNYTSAQKCITDSIGNMLIFDNNGRLVSSKSHHATPIVKQFVYDSDNHLVEVYDTRTSVSGGKVKNRISLTYNTTNGLLESVTAYVNNLAQQSIRYTYSSTSSLTDVTKVCYNQGQATETKLIWHFAYDSVRLLAEITDCQTHSACKVTYDLISRVSKVESGVNVNSVFTGKSLSNYTFTMISNSDEVSCKTEVADKNGIKIAYFICRDARVVSSFEETSLQLLKTLNKQGEKRSGCFDNETAPPTINGKKSRLISNGKFEVALNGLDISRNKLEKGNINYNYSCWIKYGSTCKRLQAEVTCSYTNGANTTKRITLDSKAINAWQRMDLPITVNKDSDGNPNPKSITKIAVNFIVNGFSGVGTFYVNEIGFAPAEHRELHLRVDSSAQILPYSSFTAVSCNSGTIVTDNINGYETYFTESDVAATIFNQLSPNGDKDAICNGGTKRISYAVGFKLATSSGVTTSTSSNNPFRTVISLPSPNSTITTVVQFGNDITVTNYASASSSNGTATSTTKSVVDYFGNTLSQTDEYGMTTVYEYNDDGSIKSQTVKDANGNVGAQQVFDYDEEGQVLTVAGGTIGQQITYDAFSQPSSVIETMLVGGSYQPTGRRIETLYDNFHIHPTNVMEYCADSVIPASNSVTYQDGRISTATDGVAKYGVQYDLANDTVSYTQFDGSKEVIVEQDKLTKNSSTGEQTLTKTFFDGTGNVSYSVAATVDKYGKVTQIANSSSDGTNETLTVKYDVDNITESKYTANVKSVSDSKQNSSSIVYDYDNDGNTVSVNVGEYYGKVFVQQIADSITMYSYAITDNYFDETIYDNSVVMSPRVKETAVYSDNTGAGAPTNKLWRVCYNHDGFGRVTSKQNLYSDDFGYEGSIPKQTFSYKDDGVRCSMSHTNYHSNKLYRAGNTRYTIDLDEQNGYDEMGRINSVQKTVTRTLNTAARSYPTNVSYTYDKLGRVTYESNAALGIQRSYAYRSNGKRDIFAGKYCRYNALGQLTNLGQTAYTYDSQGNRTSKKVGTSTTQYTYQYGKLTGAGNVKYIYGVNGTLVGKGTTTSPSTTYVYEGNKLLRETILGTKLKFFYDNMGLSHVYCQGSTGLNPLSTGYYEYVLDTQGNVSMLIDCNMGDIAARYEYDMWGNCTVYRGDGTIDTDKYSIGNLNPFRWKSYHYDTETGLYYINGRYYDPESATYLDALPVSSILNNAFAVRRLDRNGIMCYNAYYFASSPYTMATTVDLATDPNYNETVVVEAPKSVFEWVLFGIGAALVVAATITLIVASFGGVSGLVGAIAVGAAKGALLGAVAGSVLGVAGGAIYGAATDSDMGSSILSGFLMGFGAGAILGAIVGGITGANSWYNIKALEFTQNPDASEVVLGRGGVYESVATERNATYFKMAEQEWELLKNNPKRAWRINKAFLKQQISAGKNFVFASDPLYAGGYYFTKEVNFLIRMGILTF